MFVIYTVSEIPEYVTKDFDLSRSKDQAKICQTWDYAVRVKHWVEDRNQGVRFHIDTLKFD